MGGPVNTGHVSNPLHLKTTPTHQTHLERGDEVRAVDAC